MKIAKWKIKYDRIDPHTKDPGLMRARKQLEKKRPRRRSNVKYWSEGQFRTLIEAGPAKLASSSMIPYQVLIYLLTRTGTLHEVHDFLDKRFNTPDRIEGFHKQLDHMIANLAALGYLTRSEDGDHIELRESLHELSGFRSVDPLYGAFLAKQLSRGSLQEKLQALESVLPLPPALGRRTSLPEELVPGPLQTEVLEPELLRRGLLFVNDEGCLVQPATEEEYEDHWAEDKPPHTPCVAEMLKIMFDAKLETPEDIRVEPRWAAGGIFDYGDDFYKFVQNRDLVKNEGLILRHLLRLVILTGEFRERSDDDPDYAAIAERITEICTHVDRRYTDHFLADQEKVRAMDKL